MKFVLFVFLVWLTFVGTAQTNTAQKKFIVGGYVVNRYIKGYDSGLTYPRFSFEYRLSESSSFEILAEYINNKLAGRKIISYPLSVGYKLNILPWFIKNEKIIDKLKIYNSFRYTILLSTDYANIPASELQVYHYFRYAPGIDYFFNKNWGINSEMVFGKSMRTTMALGVKYRF